jgi:hypothetical protein
MNAPRTAKTPRGDANYIVRGQTTGSTYIALSKQKWESGSFRRQALLETTLYSDPLYKSMVVFPDADGTIGIIGTGPSTTPVQTPKFPAGLNLVRFGTASDGIAATAAQSWPFTSPMSGTSVHTAYPFSGSKVAFVSASSGSSRTVIVSDYARAISSTRNYTNTGFFPVCGGILGVPAVTGEASVSSYYTASGTSYVRFDGVRDADPSAYLVTGVSAPLAVSCSPYSRGISANTVSRHKKQTFTGGFQGPGKTSWGSYYQETIEVDVYNPDGGSTTRIIAGNYYRTKMLDRRIWYRAGICRFNGDGTITQFETWRQGFNDVRLVWEQGGPSSSPGVWYGQYWRYVSATQVGSFPALASELPAATGTRVNITGVSRSYVIATINGTALSCLVSFDGSTVTPLTKLATPLADIGILVNQSDGTYSADGGLTWTTLPLATETLPTDLGGQPLYLV